MGKIMNYLTEIMNMKQKALDVIDRSGLPADVCSVLKKDLRYSIQIKTERVKNGESLPIGQTKFGGVPHLPDHIEWPMYHDQYIPFFCQLNLEEVAPWDFENRLPKKGWLYVFDTQEPGEGYNVIYYDGDIQNLKPRYLKDESMIFEWGELYHECKVSFAPAWMLATYPSAEFKLALEKNGIDDPLDVYWEVTDELDQLTPDFEHRIFGYPYMGYSGTDDRETLLLEVSSNDEMDLTIWDAGLAQYFMPVTDQKPFCDFEKVERGIYSS